MTDDEIRAEIAADPALQALVPDTTTLATALSAGRWKWAKTEIGKGTIIETLGLAAANGVIDAILAAPDYRHVKELLEQGRLRLDIAAQGGLLQPLVPDVMSQAQHDALCNRAKEAVTVDEFAVRRAIYNDDGSLRV